MSERDLALVRRLRRRRERLDREFPQAIVAAKLGGETYAAIARAAGLSVSRIHGIVKDQRQQPEP